MNYLGYDWFSPIFVGLERCFVYIFKHSIYTTIIFFSEKEKIRTIKNCDIDIEIMKKKLDRLQTENNSNNFNILWYPVFQINWFSMILSLLMSLLKLIFFRMEWKLWSWIHFIAKWPGPSHAVCYRQTVKQFTRSSIQIFKLFKAVVGRQVSNNVYFIPQIFDNSLEKSEGQVCSKLFSI